MNKSEKSTNDLRDAFNKALWKATQTQSQADVDGLRKVGDDIRARYFALIENVEKQFKETIVSGNETSAQQFLIDNSFMFAGFSQNVAIYTDYSLTHDIVVDCVVVGEKYFAQPAITLIKLKQANFDSRITDQDFLEYLRSSFAQVSQWVDWLKDNSHRFEKKLREQVHRDLPDTNYPSTHPDLEFMFEFSIITGHKNLLSSKQLHLLSNEKESISPIKLITYDSLFENIYEENKKPIMSSGWWTEDIRLSENVPVFKRHSFYEG